MFTNLRKSLLENEKSVFKDAIHAGRTYNNKKRKSETTLTKQIKNIHDQLGPQYESLTVKDQQTSNSDKVERWLMKCSTHRQPCADLDPNVGQLNLSNKKRCLRSSSKFNNIENEHSSYENFQNKNIKTKTGRKSNNLESAKGNNIKKESTPEITISPEDVKCGYSNKSDHPELSGDDVVVIEDSQEATVEKDNMAYLQVLYENQQTKQKNVADDNKAMKCIQSYIENLRVEIAHIEGKVQPHPVLVKDRTRLWTKHSLLKVLYEHVDQIKYFQINVNRKKSVLQTTKPRLKCKRLQSKMFKNIKKSKRHIRYFRKPLRDVSVQTDFPCHCTDLVVTSLSEKNGLNFEPQKSSQKSSSAAEVSKVLNFEQDIIEFDTLSQKQSSLKSERVTCSPRESASDDSLHNTPGSHTVTAQFHASHDQLDAGVSDRENNNKENYSRVQQANEDSPPSFWKNQYCTPTKRSPTYTLTPPSNSSSNKENHDPWETPKNVKKTSETKKQKESTAARRPLNLLFEAPRAKVVVACSLINSSQLIKLNSLCRTMGWVYSDSYTPEVTHLVVAADEDCKAKRTVKYLCAVAASAWVVSAKWVEQCYSEDCHLSEEPFEVLDWSGEPGPILSRLDPYRLLSGFTVCVLPSVTTIRPEILESALRAAGARTVAPRELGGGVLLSHVVALHEATDADDVNKYREIVSKWKVTVAVLHYEWAVETISRHCLMSVAAYLLPHALDTHAHSDTHAHTDTQAHSDTHANTDTHAHTGTHARTGTGTHAYEWLFRLCRQDSQQSL